MKHGLYLGLSLLVLLSGCSRGVTPEPRSAAIVTPNASTTHWELTHLPPPVGRIAVAIYNFRDQTGQYKQVPNISSLSTAVTQGGTAMLSKALQESGWFTVLEREGLQNLLTERKIVRATMENAAKQMGAPPQSVDVPPLKPSQILIEGGVVAYETDVLTGGFGAKYFGAGGSTEYRADQATIYLRAVDVRSGQVAGQVSATKTIFSHEVRFGLFRYVSFKRLLEVEGGFTTNEPTQLCILEGLEKAVVGLIVEGIVNGTWKMRHPDDFQNPVIQRYLEEKRRLTLSDDEAAELLDDDMATPRALGTVLKQFLPDAASRETEVSSPADP